MSPANDDRPDRPEWDLLRALSLSATPTEDHLPLLEACDLDRLTGHALRHKLGPALGALMEVPGAEDLVHRRGRDAVLDLLLLHRVRNRAHTQMALDVVARFEEAGVPLVINKGVVLQFLLYAGRGSRMMSDVDIMVHPDDVRRAEELLTGLGGVFGQYDRVRDEVTPLTRERRLVHALSPDHLPDAWFHRGDPVAPYVSVDTAYSVTWAGCPWQVDMNVVLARRGTLTTTPGVVGGPVGDLPTLEPAWLWLFTALHLFREAWVVRGVRDNSTSLTQFRDVALLWGRLEQADRARVAELVDLTDLHYPAAWVAHHTDAVLGTALHADLAAALGGGGDGGEAPPWNTAFSMRDEVLVWDETMEERLRSGVPVGLRESEWTVEDLRRYRVA